MNPKQSPTQAGFRRKIALAVVLFLFCGAIVYGATLTRDMRQKLENIRMASAVYDRSGRLIGNLYYYRRIWQPLSKIPRNLQNAVVAIEDARFYRHNGIDLRGMARAVMRDLIPGHSLEGGSTITQQLAKIVLLSSERTLSRKLQDISYALEIEKVYTKQEILELYLNSVYLAHGNVGMEAASRYYFNKSTSQLSLEEAALLAGLIRSPENYSPTKHPQAARERRNVVLKEMLEQKYISQSQYKRAVASGLHVVKQGESAGVGAYFLDYVREYLVKNLGFSEDELRWGGYKIYTTLDLNYQRRAELALQQIPGFSAKIQPQAALVTLDPTNGGILAMVGGRDYARSQLNRSITAYRQPGSAVKPFVYATAFEKGAYNAASVFEDKPLSITLENGTVWTPTNYDNTYNGRMTLREALRQSVNSVAVQLLQAVGVDAVAEQMEKMVINSLVKSGSNNDLNLAPLALGGLTKGVTPMELALAYTPFANQGNLVKPFAVRKVLDGHGNLLKQFAPASPQPALSPQTAFIMTMLMEDVIDRGTGVRAKLPERPAAGKTGTTSDYTNAWFVGYTPDLLTTVWIGNDRQGVPMRYKEGNIGSASAAEIWGNYMRAITVGRPVTQFTQPSGIVWADVNPDTGQAVPGWLAGNSYKEVFAEQNVPQSAAYKLWHWLFPGQKEEPQTEAPGTDGADTPNPGTPATNGAEPVVSPSPAPGNQTGTDSVQPPVPAVSQP